MYTDDRSAPSIPIVLVVDDDADTRDMYTVMLEATGLRVIAAGNGETALQHASGVMPSVVVTDVAMPGPVTAAELCRFFHAAGVPVVAITGLRHDSPPVEELQGAGCDVMEMKPVELDRLSEIVQRVLAERRESARQTT